MNERLPKTVGEVGVLNVGSGDTKLLFDPKNPAERIRAARIVKDMIRRGYALLIEVDAGGVKKYVRALDFDESVCEYIIADFDPVTAESADAQERKEQGHEQQDKAETKPAQADHARPKKGGKRRVPAEGTRAVSVAPSAGG